MGRKKIIRIRGNFGSRKGKFIGFGQFDQKIYSDYAEFTVAASDSFNTKFCHKLVILRNHSLWSSTSSIIVNPVLAKAEFNFSTGHNISYV